MAYEFHLPDIGEGLVEAVVVEWLVEEGDELALDQPMVAIETDKAVVEIPAPRAGVVLHVGAAEGATIEVDSLLIVIGERDEAWKPAPRTETAAPIVGTLSETAEVLPAAAAGAGGKALPKVRKLAAELGVDLDGVTGSGPGGRITEDDVRSAGASDSGPTERRPFSPTRRAIAAHLARSWREIPHVWTYGEADAEHLLAARRVLADATGAPVPLETFLIRAALAALAEFPEFNAHVDADAIVLRRYFDIGFAVDSTEGLMVAVVKGADGLDDAGLAAEVSRLSVAVRDRTARPDELRGATFTVSNIGAVGGRYGTPIVPYGTTAILSVGRADPAAVVRDGEVVVAREFPLTLAYDHRAIDGATGRAFLAAVTSAIEGAA